MARLVKLTEGIDKEFWSIFFSKLISEYIQDKKFFDMLCTITYPFDDFCRIVHKAYQNTLEEINEISDPSLQNWLLVKKLKSRIVQSPNTTLLEISDKVIITIKEELMKKEKSMKIQQHYGIKQSEMNGNQKKLVLLFLILKFKKMNQDLETQMRKFMKMRFQFHFLKQL